MKKILLLIYILSSLIYCQPKNEVRAVWVTTAYNLDWPKTYGEENQKAEILNLFDALKDANFNTVFFQVRARGDLIYPSKIEPWSKSILSKLKGKPDYDPLKFIIAEAHKRGLEIHAWWNVFKVYGKGEPDKSDSEHVINKHPEFCKRYGEQWWIDPGIPSARKYLLSVAAEMLHNYDLDGVHLDYIRYPNPDFNDGSTYRKYGNGVNKDDWRRNNVTDFVEALYGSIQSINPVIKLGCAPLGIYKNTENGYSGWEAFADTYQDPVRWIRDKKLDYVSPQTYWKINSIPNFSRSLRSWENIISERQIFPGVAAFKTEKDINWPLEELSAQIDSSRAIGVEGQAFFRAENLLENNKNILIFLKSGVYKYPAKIPPMSWKDQIKPLPPTGLTSYSDSKSKYTLFWRAPTNSIDGDTASYYNIYISKTIPLDLDNPLNFYHLRLPADSNTFDINLNSYADGKYFICITSLDRENNESIPSSVITIMLQKSVDVVKK